MKYERFEQYFKGMEKIGSGGQGTVFKAVPTKKARKELGVKDLPKIVAVKRMRLPKIEDVQNARGKFKDMALNIWKSDMEPIAEEINVLKQLRLRRSMTYYGCFANARFAYVVMEYVEGDSLTKVINSGLLTPSHMLTITKQLSEAIVEMHESGIIHRDIKPDNIMCTLLDSERAQIKVIDYGMSCVHAMNLGNCKDKGGTPAFEDPHQTVGDAQSMILADWWAYGHVLVALYGKFLMHKGGRFRTVADLSPAHRARFQTIPNWETIADLIDPRKKQTERPTMPIKIVRSRPVVAKPKPALAKPRRVQPARSVQRRQSGQKQQTDESVV